MINSITYNNHNKLNKVDQKGLSTIIKKLCKKQWLKMECEFPNLINNITKIIYINNQSNYY